MKNLQSYIIALAAGSLLTACSQNDDILPAADDTATLSVELSVDSRAGRLTALPDPSQYYVICNNQTSIVDFKSGVSNIKTPITLTKSNSTVTAYYPYSEAAEDLYKSEKIWKVSATDDTDYMYGASGSVSVYSPKATVTMHHALSYIIFHISPNSYLAEDVKESVNIQSLTLKNVATDGYISGTSVYGNNYNGAIKFPLSANNFSQDEITAEHFCLPYYLYDKVDKVLELGLGAEYGTISITIPYSSWRPQSGKVYHYYVTIDGKHEGTLSTNVTVEDWKTSGSNEITIK